ncbi:helix-turn-helix domain-containing protein [Rhodoferax sp. GW822-FHT02A01]|uniref:helix-turn-helix domain-containing protein n=1 Tax=Rhodoferax sp. GW822-FHT02A01 TaxID=3141537 RepID=UPI00315DB10D
MSTPAHTDITQRNRLDAIAQARRALLVGERCDAPLVAPWVERSWQRCLQQGLQPQACAEFDVISSATARHTAEGNARLVQTARPLLEKLGRAIVNTGYFAILTNQHGVVVDVNGPIDRSDRRADLITRIGTDLSEQRVGTTAIGTALSEQQPVWLHRGEHFFSNTSVYSCAGAPVFGANGSCIGMLDLTGIDAVERPELCHLVTQVAGKISNAMVLAHTHSVMLRLNWPGNTLGNDADGIVCLDADGWITGANAVARQMVSGLGAGQLKPVHAEEVFGLPLQMVFDAAKRSQAMLEIPLWTGLRLQASAVLAAHENLPPHYDAGLGQGTGRGLKDMETAMIRRAVEQAKGNVAKAAQTLGISRATVYRKLGRQPKS